nr:acyl-CoA dehydrogenase family protein [Deinococcus cavernae]
MAHHHFHPTDDQRTIISSLRQFLKDRVEPGAAERDQTSEFPFDIVRELGEMGIMGAQTPEEYGGSGLDTKPSP